MTFWKEISEVCKKYNKVIISCDGCYDISCEDSNDIDEWYQNITEGKEKITLTNIKIKKNNRTRELKKYIEATEKRIKLMESRLEKGLIYNDNIDMTKNNLKYEKEKLKRFKDDIKII